MRQADSVFAAGDRPAMRETHEVGARTREWTVGHPVLAECGITMAGISHARSGFRFATRGWAFGQLLICFDGQGRVRVDDRWQPCGPGTAYINPPGVPHAYEALSRGAWKLCWVVYHPPFDDTPLGDLSRALLLRTDPRPLRSAITCFHRESNGRADPAILRGWADLIHLLGMRIAFGGHGDERLGRVWEVVGADLSRPWTVADLSDLIGVSDEHLRRLCQEQLARSPMEHVTHLRMRRAALLLQTTDLKIESIAQQVAYADRFGFSAAFRRHHGLSPAQYRRQQENLVEHGAVTQPPRGGVSEGQEAAFTRLATTRFRSKRPYTS